MQGSFYILPQRWCVDGIDYKMLKLFLCLLFLMLISLSAKFTCQVSFIRDFFFSNTPCECPPPPDTAHIVRLAPHWVELELRCWGEVCVFSDRAPQPYAIRMQMSFGILKRRISPGCILMLPPHTLSLSAQGWSLASSHCLTAETFSLGSS